jgi:outer membrane protein assembly factor BamB
MFGSDCGTFWCLDRHTGRIKWFFGTQDRTGKGIISSPVVSEGRVYFGAYDGVLYCLNADTGEVKWANPCCDWIGSSPLIVNDAIYIGLEYNNADQGGAMAAFDKITGEMYWSHPTKVQLHGSPAYNTKHGYILWGTNDGTVVVIDTKDNSVIKEFDAGGAVKYAPVTHSDLAIFGSFDGNIYVWDFIQDKVMFSYKTDDIVYSTPLILGNRAFMGSADHQFVVIDLETFSLVSAWDAGEKIHSSPAFANGLVYFGTSKGELFGIYPATLRPAVELQFPERITNAIVSDGNNLFVYTVDNKLWAIKHG